MKVIAVYTIAIVLRTSYYTIIKLDPPPRSPADVTRKNSQCLTRNDSLFYLYLLHITLLPQQVKGKIEIISLDRKEEEWR